MVNVVFQVFVQDTEDKLRLKPKEHKKSKKGKVLDAHEYIKYKRAYYISEKRWRNVYMPESFIASYPKVVKEVYKSEMKIKSMECVSEIFCNALRQIQQSANDFCESIDRISESKIIILAIERIERVTNFNGVIPNPKEEQLTDSSNLIRICHKYLVYDVNPLAQDFGELFNDTTKYKGYMSCLADAILNTWADSYNAYYKRKKLNYELIAKIVGKIYDPTKPFPLSWNEAVLVFRHLRVRAKMYNENGELEADYSPVTDKTNKLMKTDTHLQKIMNVLRRDGHAYEIDDPNIKTSLSLKALLDVFKEIKLGAKYSQVKSIVDIFGVAHTIDEAVQMVIQTINDENLNKKKICCEDRYLKLIWTGQDLRNVLKQLVFTSKYIPTISLNSCGEISQLTIKVENVRIQLSIPNVSADTIKTEAFQNMTNEEAKAYEELKQKVFSKFTSPIYKSRYSTQFLDMLKTYKRAAMTEIIAPFDGEVIGLDMTNCYPSLVYNEDVLPIYHGDFEAYDGHTINDNETYTKYYVELKGDIPTETHLYIIMNQKYDIIHGFNVSKVRHLINIVGFIRPYKLVPNGLKQCIEETISNNVLSNEVLKNVRLSAIGKWGTLNNKKDRYTMFIKESDAHSFHRKMGLNSHTHPVKVIGFDPIYPLNKDGITDYLTKLYVVNKSREREMIDGFKALQHLVYDRCRFKMSQLAQEIKRKGCNVLAIKTDCLLVSKSDATKLNYPWKKDVDRSKISNMGKIKKEECTMPPGSMRPLVSSTIQEIEQPMTKVILSVENKVVYGPRYNGKPIYESTQEYVKLSLKYVRTKIVDMSKVDETKERQDVIDKHNQIVERSIPNVYVLKNECDNNEAFKRIDITLKNTKRMCIKADHAGSGKSHMCLSYLIHKLLKPIMKNEADRKKVLTQFFSSHIIACPQNAQAREIQCMDIKELQDKGFNSCTTYMLCGKVLNDDGEVENGSGFNTRYKIVILEEVGQYTVEEWNMIQDYMVKCPNTMFISNGDVNQCEPVEEHMNPAINPENFYNNIIDANFPTQILLKEPKRYANEELKQKAMKLKEDLIDKKEDQIQVLKSIAKRIEIQNITTDSICVTYKQDTRRELNELMHRRVIGNGERYFKGLVLRANTRFYVHKYKYQIQKNYDFEVVEVRDNCLVLIEKLIGFEFEVEKPHYNNFSLPYAFTGHSQQGRSVSHPVVIFDYDFHHVNRKWLYVALTRNRNLEVYYCDHKFGKGMEQHDLQNKIQGYKSQDRLAKRSFKEDEYITSQWYYMQSAKQKHQCYLCKDIMNMKNIEGDGLNHTADRIDNSVAHLKFNCKLCCLKCNISKK
jgi:hypothetical protein